MRTLIACFLLVSAVAHAGDDHDAKRAQDYLKAGLARFEKHAYKDALAAFKRGFEHKPEAIFHYHLGQCYRLLGETGEALKEYREFLAKAPDAHERAEVEKYVGELDSGAKPVAGKPLAEKPLPEKPAPEKPLPEKPAAEKPLAERPLADKPLADKPLADKPVVATEKQVTSPNAPPAKEKLLILADDDEVPAPKSPPPGALVVAPNPPAAVALKPAEKPGETPHSPVPVPVPAPVIDPRPVTVTMIEKAPPGATEKTLPMADDVSPGTAPAAAAPKEKLMALPDDSAPVGAAPQEKLMALPDSSPPAAIAPTPIYKKWWLWTIVGVVVVGGAAVGLGVALARPGDAAIPTNIPGGFHAVSF